MQTAQQQIEEWLTETVYRTIYFGKEIAPRLRRISEALKASDEGSQDFIQLWLLGVNDDEFIYRAKEIQNKLIDLWSLTTNFEKVLDDVALTLSAG